MFNFLCLPKYFFKINIFSDKNWIEGLYFSEDKVSCLLISVNISILSSYFFFFFHYLYILWLISLTLLYHDHHDRFIYTSLKGLILLSLRTKA